MRVTIKRVGGMLPTLSPSISHELESLDDPTRESLLRFVAEGDRLRSAPHAEAMSYVFHVEDGGEGTAARTVSASFNKIPEALRGLLPKPR